MIFDFKKFAQIAASVYPGGVYSLDDVLQVFSYYFKKYEQHTGRPHPPIRASQIMRIAQDMPHLTQESKGCSYEDISPLDYRTMIDQHFATKYRRCDYNINHFFSGRIRALHFYETCY